MRRFLSKLYLFFRDKDQYIYMCREEWEKRQRQEFIKELAEGFSRWHGNNEEFAEAYQILLHNFTRPADKEE